MELGIKQRLILLQVLPQEGDFTTLKIIRDLVDSLGFSEDEHKRHNIRVDGGQFIWDNGEEIKDIPIGEKATDIISNAFRKLNDEKKLRIEHMELYEGFTKE